MYWYLLILDKVASVVRDVTKVFTWVLEDIRRRQWADFAIVALLAAGVGLVSIWTGMAILFIAVAMFVRRWTPTQSIYRNGDVGGSTWLEEDLDDYAAGNSAYTFLRDDE